MFSGNSLRNRDWINEARAEFSGLFGGFYIQNYRHWGTGEQWIDLNYELETLERSAKNIKGEYGIFAKSIGTVLTAKALKVGILSPRFLLLVGLPMDYITSNYPGFAQVIFDAGVATSVIHNQFDKVGSAQEASEFMAKKFIERGDYQFITTPGDTHDYEDYDLLRSELNRLKTLTK